VTRSSKQKYKRKSGEVIPPTVLVEPTVVDKVPAFSERVVAADAEDVEPPVTAAGTIVEAVSVAVTVATDVVDKAVVPTSDIMELVTIGVTDDAPAAVAFCDLPVADVAVVVD